MAYVESFSECMQGANVNIDPGAVGDPSNFGDAVAYIKSWLDSLDGDTRQALDDASQHPEKVAGYLVEANIAPAVPGLMEAFDSTSGMPLSTFLDWCIYCAEQASQANQEGGN